MIQLFYNPKAGSYSPRALDKLIAAFREKGEEVILTEIECEVPSIDVQATRICIAGGDGTIRRVAAMLVKSECTLPTTFYPLGTINLLAREMPFTREARDIAQDLINERVSHPHNPVTFGDSMFFACASVGPDSLTVSRLSPALKARIGKAAYAVGFFRLLLRWRRPQLTIHTGDLSIKCEAVYIAKGRYYAGPWSIAPSARVADRLLHVLALRRARRRDYLRFAIRLVLGRIVTSNSNEINFTCSNLEIDGDVSLPVQADGDIVAQCPVTLAIGQRPIMFY